MNVEGIPTRTVRACPDEGWIEIIDQTGLPHDLRWVRVDTLDGAVHAIRGMQVRGAPLIGATAAYGLAIAMGSVASDSGLRQAVSALAATRPTAVNLGWALHRMQARLDPLPAAARAAAAWAEAEAIADEDVAANREIGRHGLDLLRRLRPGGDRPLGIMTHCNAGWLATVDHGTALSAVYAAWDAGLPLHVWVSETRPRNQGLLTAWELAQHGVPHTAVADNTAGVLIQGGEVDAVIVGADRVAANGDVANKVGTYLKALACSDSGIPFYVAAPRSSVDLQCPSGAAIPIEQRDGEELRVVHGVDAGGRPSALRQLPAGEAVGNPAFDITPARLVSAIITECGIYPATPDGLQTLGQAGTQLGKERT